jgi:hypothetical protein
MADGLRRIQCQPDARRAVREYIRHQVEHHQLPQFIVAAWLIL